MKTKWFCFSGSLLFLFGLKCRRAHDFILGGQLYWLVQGHFALVCAPQSPFPREHKLKIPH